MPDDVSLTDLEVIQRYSLAVRGATASRADLVRTLRADLAWLTGRVQDREDELEDGPAPGPSPYRLVPSREDAGGSNGASASSLTRS